MSNYSPELKNVILSAYATRDIPVSRLLKQYGIPKSTFYNWLQETKSPSTDTFNPTNFHRMKQHNEHLENMVSALKEAHCTPSDPLKIKLSEIDRLYGKYSIHVLCDAFNVSRGTFYNH